MTVIKTIWTMVLYFYSFNKQIQNTLNYNYRLIYKIFHSCVLIYMNNVLYRLLLPTYIQIITNIIVSSYINLYFLIFKMIWLWNKKYITSWIR